MFLMFGQGQNDAAEQNHAVFADEYHKVQLWQVLKALAFPRVQSAQDERTLCPWPSRWK